MIRVPALVAFTLLLPLALPTVMPSGTCEPTMWEEGNSIQRIGQRVEAGPVTFYLVSGGARTLGQSTFELWEEWNGVDGLQKHDDCGVGADRWITSFCVFRTGVLGALECPSLSTSDLADYAVDHVGRL